MAVSVHPSCFVAANVHRKMWIRWIAAGAVLGLVLIAAFLFAIGGGCQSDCDDVASRLDGVISFFAQLATGENSPTPVATLPIPRLPEVVKEPSQPTPRTPVLVNSFEPHDQSDTEGWNRVAYQAGHVDAVRSARGAVAADGRITVAAGDVVELRGWAGHPAHGLRFRDVLLSLCGKIVGRARVNIDRPDVASAVHPNLSVSGWRAKLAADHMPRCDNAVLQAWGVAPVGHNIFPLFGDTAMSVTGTVQSPTTIFASRWPPLMPANNSEAKLKKIDVRASELPLRKCGAAACEVVGRIAQGTHEGYVLERAGDWSLFQIGASAGWASNKLIAIQ